VLDAACNNRLVASTPGALASNDLDETSGIAASRRVDDVWWVHNDSGDSARVFAINGTGATLGEYDLSGATAVDWEDIAAGPGPSAGVSYLYVGDIGDNTKSRAAVQVYRVPEPLVDPGNPAAAPVVLTGVDRLSFVYPDGPHDAEALIVDPTTGELYIITKDLLGGVGQVFRAAANLPEGSTTVLSQVATLSLGPGFGITAADITPAGDVIAVRTYLDVRLYPRDRGMSIAQAFAQPSCASAAPPFGSASSASEPQGEALGFTRDGRGYMTVSEGLHQSLHRFVAP
jgi:hypothetical protein